MSIRPALLGTLAASAILGATYITLHSTNGTLHTRPETSKRYGLAADDARAAARCVPPSLQPREAHIHALQDDCVAASGSTCGVRRNCSQARVQFHTPTVPKARARAISLGGGRHDLDSIALMRAIHLPPILASLRPVPPDYGPWSVVNGESATLRRHSVVWRRNSRHPVATEASSRSRHARRMRLRQCSCLNIETACHGTRSRAEEDGEATCTAPRPLCLVQLYCEKRQAQKFDRISFGREYEGDEGSGETSTFNRDDSARGTEEDWSC
ncbi:uncharacterized protein BXZ73DRAFT_77968 [Epithele typhae]|uniref:uncharacterized protein n=1 Tax=Epithele typhae TaxID=378194 RepID=UPI002008235A|nr:uncharacterized protein BXZ73DRAFT_77968 [Epithele typhae]KAH9930541.1 hypothetical protein BXZ73DRAFT_77968 [Epithele typhae]